MKNKKEIWLCWTENGKGQDDTEHFRGNKTSAMRFYKDNKRTIPELHYGKLLLENINGRWIEP
jgi:hypothetical protein